MQGEQLFHVVLDGNKVGPYDRRTIIGMRVKKLLRSEHVLVDASGRRMTVADLLGSRSGGPDPGRSTLQGAFTCMATFRGVRGRGQDIPAFKGEVEVRVKPDVLRIAGRYRKGLGWQEDRVKLPLPTVHHAVVVGDQVDVALSTGEADALQWVSLGLSSERLARAFAAALPAREPVPEGAPTSSSGPLSSGGLLAPLSGLLRRR